MTGHETFDDMIIPVPLTKDEVIDLLSAGATIQPNRQGASVITDNGRCADDWEELRRDGWLSKTIAGTYVLSDAGRARLKILGEGSSNG